MRPVTVANDQRLVTLYEVSEWFVDWERYNKVIRCVCLLSAMKTFKPVFRDLFYCAKKKSENVKQKPCIAWIDQL